MGSITGPVLAITLFIAVPEVLRVANMWRLVAYGLILVLIMIFRPSGILGYHELSFEWICSLFKRKTRNKSAGGREI
jgi:branched-chain amino acid transport system permease protein